MISSIFNLLVPIAQLFLLWKIWRTLKPIAEIEDRKAELNDNVRKFAAMFAEAAEIPKPKKFSKKELDEVQTA